jgi:hypothetical protein
MGSSGKRPPDAGAAVEAMALSDARRDMTLPFD